MCEGWDTMKVTIRQGDSLWYYSQLFSVPYQLLIDINRSCREFENTKYAVIPGYEIERYEITDGESIQNIAVQYKLPLDAMLVVNQTFSPNDLEVFVPKRLTDFSIYCKKNYDYKSLIEDLRILKEHYPFLKIDTIGHSVLGQEIPHVKIGTGPKQIHFNGSFHANEWITTAIIMNFINDYLIALTNQNKLRGIDLLPFYQSFTLSIVPMVNPDGVDLVHHGPPKIEPYKSFVMKLNGDNDDFRDWKANIRGVDLNNQYPAKWEIEQKRKPQNPASRDFPGISPLTEPEAIAMAELTKKGNFDIVVAFHTQGKEIYWDFLGREPNEAESVVLELEKVSSYKAVKDIDSYAGYKDWFIYEYGRLGFTVELGIGVNPLPLSQFDEIYKESLGIFLASQYMLFK
jgi:g-D-glutamyl-meso-diaminopimelate peptidase